MAAVSTIAQDAFSAGFGPYMVCVAPPSGKPGPGASGSMGKLPAVYREDTGEWVPLGVQRHRCEDLLTAQHWDALGANVGLKCGAAWNLAFVDLDIDDHKLVQIALGIFQRKFGSDIPVRGVDDPCHMRVGIALRVKGPLRGRSITYQHFVTGEKHKVEVLADGRQFVAWGVHPAKGASYGWLSPIPTGPESFPEVDLETLKEVLVEIEEAFKDEDLVRVSGQPSSVFSPNPIGTAGPDRVKGTQEEIARLLALIPNDEKFDAYDDWTRVCFALINASEGAAWARDLWVEWSNQVPQRKGTGYPAQKWDENRHAPQRQGVGYWWLRKEALARDPTRLAEFDQHPVIDDEVETTARGITGAPIVPVVFGGWAYCAREHKFFSFTDLEFYPVAGFDNRYSAYVVKLKNELGVTGRGLFKPSSLYFNNYPDRVFITGVTYHPGRGRLIRNGQNLIANRWREGFTVTHPGTTDTDVMPFLDHAKLVLRDDFVVACFIKWCAYVVQFPDRKPNWAMMISTVPGLGKDFLIRALIHAVGQDNHTTVSADMLSSTFNDYLEAKLLTVSETRQSSGGFKSNSDIYNDLKQYLARPPEVISVNNKNMKRFDVPNLSAWIFLSNHRAPLFVEEEDRRLLVVENMDTPRQSDDYYVQLKNYLDDNLDLIASFFAEYALTDADIRLIEGQAPKTRAKQALIQVNRDPLTVALEEIVADARSEAGQGKAGDMVMTVGQIRDHLRDHGFEPRFMPHDSKIVGAIRALGARPVKPEPNGAGAWPIKVNGKLRRLWLLASTDTKGRDYSRLSEDDLKSLYMGGVYPTTLDIPDADGNVVSLRGESKQRDTDV